MRVNIKIERADACAHAYVIKDQISSERTVKGIRELKRIVAGISCHLRSCVLSVSPSLDV